MPSSTSENNKRIAKNTIILYMRQLFVLVVSLYTSRIILLVLGVKDFGLYTLVAGVMSSMSVLLSTTATSASRFLTFALGKKDHLLAVRTFETALFIQTSMAFVALILAETVGLWFLNTQLNIPVDRMTAANWIYQFATITLFIGIVQMPYSSVIIAHEKMSVYAYVEMFQVVTKLLIVIALDFIGNHDKLIFYGLGMMSVSILCTAFNVIYSKKHFAECRLIPKKDNSLIKSMLLFSGWDLYGAVATILAGQGCAFVINLFKGIAYNGIVGIVSQVQSAVAGCATAISQASRPQIIKYYAEGRLPEMIALMNNLCALVTLVLAIFIVPLMAEIDFVLKVWLKNPPPEVGQLTFIALISTLSWSVITTLNAGIGATGKNFELSFGSGTILMLNFPINYILLKLGYSLAACYIAGIFIALSTIFNSVRLCQKQLEGYRISVFLRRVVVPLIVLVSLSLFISLSVQKTMEEGWIRLITVITLSTFTIATSGFFIMLSKEQRAVVLRRLKLKK